MTISSRAAGAPTTTRRRGRTGAVGVAALLILATAGCASVREELGLTSEGPDAMRVVSSRPLVIPDNLPNDAEQLPEPQPGARSLVEPRPEEDAQRALTGGLMVSEGGGAPSASESALLSASGADNADPDIRTALREDIEDSESGVLLLDEWLSDGEEDTEPLDAAAESERLADRARASTNPGLETTDPAATPAGAAEEDAQ